ncbi:MAG TPA: DUF1203 domain-containing protein [Vitreimonas sp.]|jgi:hypothetical protein|nr:DUF1203 domain-containing protein [Vitreimonas sp.]
MSFRIQGIDPAPFADLHGLSEADLAARNIVRMRVSEKPSAPCRISLDDAEIGEHVLLLSYAHLPEQSPYAQGGPIFVRETQQRFNDVDVVPPALARRTLSLRGFDAAHMMIEADLTDGKDAASLIARLFANPAVAYIHAHNAKRGCFAARIDRA